MRQASALPKTAPTAPAAPGAPATSTAIPPVPPTWNVSDVVGLRARREELSNQLQSAQGRRSDVARQLQNSKVQGQARTGLEQRLVVLDDRIARLESDIDKTGQQLAAAPGEMIAGTSPAAPIGRNGLNPGQVTGISIVFTIAVLAPMSIAFARGLLRRMSAPRALPETREMNARLENLERGLEAVAIEIERMSEGQRFVTKLLSEGSSRSLAGNAEPPKRP